MDSANASTPRPPEVLSAVEFEHHLDRALETSDSTGSFLALYLIDLTDGARPCGEVAGDVLAASEAGETIGSGGRGSLAVLRPAVASPADAIARCERLVDTVRPPARIGLALHATVDLRADALLETARRGLRTAMRGEGDGDDWAVG